MNQQQTTRPSQSGSKTIIWLVVILVVVAIAAIIYYFMTKSSSTIPTATITPTSTKSSSLVGWKVYSITPGAEEASEGNSAVKFSIKYPSDWNYKIFDEEIKSGSGAGNILHYVGFSDKTMLKAENAKVTVSADSHKFTEYEAAILFDKSATKTTTTINGYNAVKVVGKVAGMSGVAEETSIAYIIEAPNPWIVIVQGDQLQEATLTSMANSLTF